MNEPKPRRYTELKPTSKAIFIGDYLVWDIDSDTFGISHLVTGEAGVFKKADFEAYVKAFFGLNF